MHCYTFDIFYDDTDASGLVYHAHYIKYMERARTHYLRSKGLSLVQLLQQHGKQFVINHVDIDYMKPVKLEERVSIITQVSQMGKASMTFDQKMYFDPNDVNTMICTGRVKIVCVNRELQPCPIPETFMREFKCES